MKKKEMEQGKKFKSCWNNRARVGKREKDKAEGKKKISKHKKKGGGEMEVCGISLVIPPINQTL